MAQNSVKPGDDVTALMEPVKSGDDVTTLMQPKEASLTDKFVSTLSDWWDRANKPLATVSPQMQKALDSYQQQHPIIGGAGNLGVGALTSLTSPLSLGLAATSGGASLADTMGASRIANIMEVPGKVAAGGMVGHGLYNVGNAPTTGGKIGGALEAGLGGLGLRASFGKPAIDITGKTPLEVAPRIAEEPYMPNMPQSLDEIKKREFARIENRAKGTGIHQETGEIIPLEPIKSGDDVTHLIQPPNPEAAPLAPAATTDVVKSPVDKLNEAIKAAVPLEGKQADIYTAEKAQRIAAFKNMPVTSQEEAAKAMGTLAGEMPKVTTEPLKLDQSDVDDLFKTIKESPKLTDGFEVPRAFVALNKVLNGQVPQDNEIKILGRVFGTDFESGIRNNMPTANRLKNMFSEAINFPKSMLASFDMSAPLRQGLGLIHRKEWWTSFDDMVKSSRSENFFNDLQESIRSKPTFELSQESGLALTDLTSLSNREEQFMSNWAEKVPGVRASNRAYTGFLNKLRSDTFDSLINDARNAGLDPDKNLALSKEIAGYVNTATGRGSLGAMEKYAVGLNNMFFSPRLIASRVKMLNPTTYINASPFVRKQYLKSALSIAGAGTAAVELGKMAGGEISNDSTNADFRKLKIGNTRLDPYGGFQPYITLMSRLINNEQTSSTTGKTYNLGTFGRPTRMGAIENFTSNKLAPVPKFAYDWLAQTKGLPFDPTSKVARTFIPMMVQDVYDVAKDNPGLLPITIPAGALGAGVQNYSGR